VKIAFNYNIFYNQRYGGISRYYTSIIKELIKKKIKLKIFSPIYKNRYLSKIHNDYISGYFLRHYPTPYYLTELIEYISFYQIQNSDFDIIHDTNYSRKTLDIKKKKIVVTVYDLIHEKFSNLYNKNLEIKKKVIEKADKIICISENTKRDLLEYYNLSEKKISIIHLGCNHFDFNISQNSKEISHLIPEKFILFVGSREKYKNFDILLNSYHRAKEINKKYKLVCFGGGKFSKNEKKKISDLSLQAKVFNFLGEDSLLSELYLKASLFVFPSNYEGFGIPIIEAMLHGCPVLASNIKVFYEVSKNSINFFKKGDENSLVNELIKLLGGNFDLNVNKKNLKLIADNYSWENCASQTLKIYEDL